MREMKMSYITIHQVTVNVAFVPDSLYPDGKHWISERPMVKIRLTNVMGKSKLLPAHLRAVEDDRGYLMTLLGAFSYKPHFYDIPVKWNKKELPLMIRDKVK